MILRKLQITLLGMELAIHIPRALYRAATVWYAYFEYGMDVDQFPGNISCQRRIPGLFTVKGE